MNEVSCKAVAPFLEAADRRGIPRAALIAGTRYPLRHVENRDERIDWDAFRAMMQNVRRYVSEDDLVAIGEEGLNTPWMRSVMIIGRTLFSAPGFYRWLVSSGGTGNLMFANIVPTYEEVTPGRLKVELRMASGYEPCREFFLFAQGGLQGLPKLIGLTTARVTRTDIVDGVRFDIDVPPERALRARVRQFVFRRFDARTAATQLDTTMRTLEARYAELEAARSAVERQRALLDTAFRFGQRIWGQRDLASTTGTITSGLIDTALLNGAALEVHSTSVSAAPERATAGTLGDDATALVVDLAGGGRIAGRLRVWPRAQADLVEARTLLDLVAPTIALALDNAFAYRELANYQKNLEQLVDERTAELRAARDALAGTVSQLEHAQEARERIFANISHEIRTPLSLILLAIADVEARAGSALDARARGELDSVVGAARKLLRLVDELLLLAAGDQHSLAVTPTATDITRLVEAIALAWRPAAEAAGLTLALDAPASCAALVDPIAFERIVTNLVSNAIKFTPRGGAIAIELSRDADELRLAVRDTGIGIEDELRRRLFGRFEQGRGAATVRGGSGIGLSLVKELVLAHGGTIAVERVPAGGTEFRISMPAIERASAAPAPVLVDATPRLRPGDYGLATAPLRSGDVLGAPDRVAATVLVAEDDPALAASIARLLAEDHTVVVALDGVTALELARQHQPQLLVTDVEMPGMSGIELTRRFRELPGNTLAPVIILSARADPGDRLAGLDAGAIDYVVKPFEPRELRARARAQLALRELALRLHRAEQLAALGTLSAGLAHELRNPANGIVNAVAPLRELLPAELTAPDAPVAQLLDVLQGCAEQVAILSRQLLGFRRSGELELRWVPAAEVIARALALVQPALKTVELRDHTGGLDRIKCAAPLLVQVLTNLIENAAHAAGPGGWVELTGRSGAGRVVLEIADSGPGVPPPLRERIFEPFFTTKPPGVGTGLGLPVARDIVHRHGGVLELRERGQRPVFVVDLPNPERP